MKRLLGALTVCLCIAGLGGTAHALYRSSKYGDFDFGGRLRTTNIVRHADFDRLAFIMQRNELKLRLEWKWLQRGKAFGRYKIPWLRRSDLFLLYRGIYDSIYDTTPGQIGGNDLQGDPIPAGARRLESVDHSLRREFKFNNRLREMYVDLYFKRIPLTLRVGKQQIVWGETDGFRMLDRANTLDLSWHFFQELPPPGFGFDELRQPFFMIKGLWDFRQLGPLAQPFLEFYWNPGDWNPGKIAFLPRPWGVRLLDPLYNKAGTGAFQSSFCVGANGRFGRGVCDRLMNGTKLFNRGNYSRNPIDNSQFGVRFHFITPGGFEWTANYLYQRWSSDGSPTAIVRGLPANGTTFVPEVGRTLSNNQFCQGLASQPTPFVPWGKNTLCLEFFSPYIHTVGLSMNYFEPNYTQTVWRLETIVDFNLPFYDGNKQTALFGTAPGAVPLVPGITKRSMWKGMLAFDRPTWIRSLNKKTTFFITGQLFWHYIINNEKRRCRIDPNDPSSLSADPSVPCGDGTKRFLPGEQFGLIGPLDLPKLTAPGGDVRFQDTIHSWELLSTLAVLGFYKGGSLVPALIYLFDPVNSYSQELALGVDWFYTPNVAFNITTRLIWAGLPWNAYAGHKKLTDPNRGQIFDPWFLAGGSRGRSETSFMITWQF